MNRPARIASYEYKNDYLYLIIRQAREQGLCAPAVPLPKKLANPPALQRYNRLCHP